MAKASPDPENLLCYRAPADLLAGRCVLITGAGGGVGQAVARMCAAHGATVVLLGRIQQRLEAVYDEIEHAGHPSPLIVPFDLETAGIAQYGELARQLKDTLGRLDALVLNAGWVGSLTPIRHYDPQLWARVMTVNLNAPFLLVRTLLPFIEQAPDAAIVFTTDCATRAYWGAYGAAKQGALGLLTILAAELDPYGIRVNGIDPGPLRTRLRAQHYPGLDLNTLPPPEAVSSAYLFFIGPDSRGINGHNVSLQAALVRGPAL